MLAVHPTLRTVAFNGQTAATLFRRHVAPRLPPRHGLTFITLPSTSPAHAGRTAAQKLELWSALSAVADPR